MRIAFIGAGKMAEALLARLTADSIIASDPVIKRLKFLKSKYRIKTTLNNLEAFEQGEIVVLAVKPQQMAEVLTQLAGRTAKTPPNKLVISIAAGIPLNYLQKKLPGQAIVRAMPNNPCLVGAGMTALAKGRRVSLAQFGVAKRLFAKVGQVLAVPEKWLDAVTGLSGSGPAIVYSVVEAMVEGGVAAGLPKQVAGQLALQTLIGAAETLSKTKITPGQLRQMVASPGGTTVEGLAVLEKYLTEKAISGAVVAAANKSKILSERWAL